MDIKPELSENGDWVILVQKEIRTFKGLMSSMATIVSAWPTITILLTCGIIRKKTALSVTMERPPKPMPQI